jgi:hypothetical protein
LIDRDFRVFDAFLTNSTWGEPAAWAGEHFKPFSTTLSTKNVDRRAARVKVRRHALLPGYEMQLVMNAGERKDKRSCARRSMLRIGSARAPSRSRRGRDAARTRGQEYAWSGFL